MINDKPISRKSVHQVGDVYRHKKHGFIVVITGRGEYSSREVKVLKGEVPKSVKDRVRTYSQSSSENGKEFLIEYSTCALTNCFERLKAGKVLYG